MQEVYHCRKNQTRALALGVKKYDISKYNIDHSFCLTTAIPNFHKHTLTSRCWSECKKRQTMNLKSVNAVNPELHNHPSIVPLATNPHSSLPSSLVKNVTYSPHYMHAMVHAICKRQGHTLWSVMWTTYSLVYAIHGHIWIQYSIYISHIPSFPILNIS